MSTVANDKSQKCGRSKSLFKISCKSLIIRRWLHLSKQRVTTDHLFLLLFCGTEKLEAAVPRSNSNQQSPQTGGKLRLQRKQFVYPENETTGVSVQCHAVPWVCNGDAVWLFLTAELLAPDELQKRSSEMSSNNLAKKLL